MERTKLPHVRPYQVVALHMEPGDKKGGYKLSIQSDGTLKAEDLYIGKDYIIE